MQLAPGQSPRYACVTRPHTPQRADGFPVPSGAVGSYVTGGGGPGHLQGRLPQPPTPPQQDPKQQAMNYGQAGVRPPPNYQYRGGPPQPQQMQRPAHHRQQTSWASPAQPQQVVFSMAPVYIPSHLQHGLPPAAYPQQQPPRTPFFQQPTSMPSMLQQQHYFSSYPNPQGQQQYMYNPPAAQQMGGAGRAQATASQQNLQQAPQQPPHAAQHPMLVPNRYTPMQHVPQPTNEKKRRAFAIAIVDPKSGKDVTDEILEEDANSEAGDRAPPQPDENSLAVVEEFARRVTEVANEKDDKDQVITDKIVIENESHISEIRENSVVIIQQSLEELTTENKPEPDPADDKYLKHSQLTELSETPVVSAISNSPEIVPKQSHITKQKLIENMLPEVKKTQPSKPKQIKPQNLIQVVIDDIPEPKEILCKEAPPPARQVSQAKPIISEEIIQKSEDKSVEVQPPPAPIENNIIAPPINLGHTTTNKSKLAYVNSQQNEQNIKDTLLNPFNRAPIHHIIPTNQETPKVPTGDHHQATPNPPQKHKQETKKNKTRLNNAERAATQPTPKVPDAEHITEVKPTQALNNASLSAVDKISPPKDVTPLKKESSVPPQVKTVVPEPVAVVQQSVVTPNQVTDELKDIVVNLEEINISIDSKIESELVIPAQATVVANLDEEIELAKEIGEKELPQIQAPAEIISAPENVEKEIIPEVTNAENSLEQNESAPKEEGEEKGTTDKPVTPMLRYSYREDQWSPLNTSGKKCYDADFLLMLRNDPNSKKKPENINQLEIVSDGLRTPRNPTEAGSRSVTMMRQNDLLPGFARSSTHNTTPNRKSQHGKPNSKGISTPGSGLNNRPNIIHVNLSLRSDVKLNETTNAWKPARMRSSTMEEDEIATQELYKTFRSVLNKLTPQKFDTLIAKVRKLNIDTKERLIGVINLVFEKAIDEPNFSVAYALMCRELEQINVPDDKEDKAVNFRSLIVGRCQSEFEKDDNTTNERKKEIDECTDPEKKKELVLALEEEERKIRRRSVGNVRFIGELFKQNIIVSNIIVYCIQRLLKKIEEETLECLCKLFTTIGKDLEKKCGLDLSPYFVNMKGIVEGKNEKVSSRVKFMLQDVIDLRHNHWVPRQLAINANPKTMDQIKQEVEMEQKSAMYTNFSSPANMSNRKDDRPNNMNKRGGSKSVTEDGWSQAPSRNARAKQTPYVVDSGKLSKMIAATPITQTSLQPSSTSMWGKGSTVTTKKAEQWTSSHKSGSSTANSGRKPVTETANMYHALDNQYSEASPASQTETASGRKMSYQSKGASIERSTFKSDTEDQEASSLSQESTCNKIKDIMTNVDSLYGIIDKIQTIFTKEEMPLVVKELILWGLEYNKKENMQIIGDVTGRLVDDENITQEEFILVVKQTIDHSVSYLTKEGNLMWKILSAFIWAHMKKNSLSLKDIHVAFSKVIELEKGFELLTAIFLEKLKDSQEHIKNLWEKSNMQLSDWMSPDSVEQFLEEFPLKWLNTKGMLSQEEACAQMLQQMQAGESRDSIKAWIDARVGGAVQDGWFIRAITEAVHTYALCPLGLDKPRFDPPETVQRLSSYYPLLSAYVATNQEKNELECLFAIQHLIHKLEYPQGITLKVFEYLWEYGEIISSDGFMSWEKNSDPLHQQGKGVLLKTLTSFFTALKSLDGSSDGSETASVIEDEY